jgi:hypothetical protein
MMKSVLMAKKILKEQSHKKVVELWVWGIRLGPN